VGEKIMKAVAVAVAPMMGLFFVLTGPVQAGRWGDLLTAKAAQKSQTQSFAKKTVASGKLLMAADEPQQFH
jgi:hypothetical protein